MSLNSNLKDNSLVFFKVLFNFLRKMQSLSSQVAFPRKDENMKFSDFQFSNSNKDLQLYNLCLSMEDENIFVFYLQTHNLFRCNFVNNA